MQHWSRPSVFQLHAERFRPAPRRQPGSCPSVFPWHAEGLHGYPSSAAAFTFDHTFISIHKQDLSSSPGPGQSPRAGYEP